MSDTFIIDNIEKFTNSARLVVFNSFGKEAVEHPSEFTKLLTDASEEDIKELDSILTQQECLAIVVENAKKQVNKNTKETRYIIDQEIFSSILEALNHRLVSNILANLSKKGLIESAYDESLNDFVFWCVDAPEDKTNKEDK